MITKTVCGIICLSMSLLFSCWTFAEQEKEKTPVTPHFADFTSTGEAGPYEVETKLGEWIDNNRNGRDVPWKVYLPKGMDKPAPVVVWSPGAFRSRDGAEYLGRHLASHGFAAFHIQHRGSDDKALKEARAKGGKKGVMQAMRVPGVFDQRNLDVPFTVNQIKNLADGELAGRIDPKRLGMSGHSLGANTTLLIAGQNSLVDGQRFAEPRFSGAFAMSSSPPRQGSLEKAYEDMLMPIFHLTGTKDEFPRGNFPTEDRQKPFHMINNVDQYLLVLDNAVHKTFSGLDPGYEKAQLDRHYAMINMAAVIFWRAYLMDDVYALEWLQKGGYKKALGDEGRLEMKAKVD